MTTMSSGVALDCGRWDQTQPLHLGPLSLSRLIGGNVYENRVALEAAFERRSLQGRIDLWTIERREVA